MVPMTALTHPNPLLVHGPDSPVAELARACARIARSDATVLITGETGVGKELFARLLHETSARASRPLVAVNCGAIPEALLESELFGHARGAFTGAVAARRGRIAAAAGGTLFLDEIGELPQDLQPKLLRALEMRLVKRLGEDVERPFDVRILAATHRDLDEQVSAGRFRSDLYFRLAVVLAKIPPLRERPLDLPLLIRHFVDAMGRGSFEPSAMLLDLFYAHPWPGNVRELRNSVERALAGVDAMLVPPPARGRGAADPTAASSAELPFKAAKEKMLDEFTRDYLSALLERSEGNVSAAARMSGIHRNYLHRLLQRYGVGR